MIVVRPKAYELGAIQQLLNSHVSIGPEHLNRRDIALVAKDQDKIVGFLWVGLMAGNKMAYVDKFTVDPAYFNKGVGSKLAQAAFLECEKRGVTEVHGIIRQDQWHDASAMNSLKVAMKADPLPYTFVSGRLAEMRREIQNLIRSTA